MPPAPPQLEEFVSISAAARLIPGGGLNPRTLLRWALRGVGGRRLRVARAGRRVVTTRAWLAQFLAEGGGGIE